MKKSILIDFVSLAAMWGASFLFMRMGAAEFGVFATAGLRVAIAAAFLTPILWFSGHWGELQRKAGAILFIGLLNSGIPFALFSYAVLSITTGMTSILNATVPLFGAVIAWLWLKDRPSNSRILGLLIGFGGVILLAGEKASFKPGGTGWAILACLLATVCYAFAASFTKRYLTGVHPLATATGSQLGASIGLALPTFWFWPAQMPGLKPWLALGALGVVCTGVAYILYFRLIERAGPARALAVTFVVPVFALTYGGLFLGEQLTLWMLVCGVIIVCGTALSTGLLKLGK
ncbi:MAG TPA: DMT family transporter [Burkholderiaceae bacterium]|jgi:drug/metabolite transporter (DMT)-like permease|nr:DMT family transporter [Burkholderiaceae bacterium]HPH12806.1 DMT family transporter [Burkholderiaceae bacterium]